MSDIDIDKILTQDTLGIKSRYRIARNPQLRCCYDHDNFCWMFV